MVGDQMVRLSHTIPPTTPPLLGDEKNVDRFDLGLLKGKTTCRLHTESLSECDNNSFSTAGSPPSYMPSARFSLEPVICFRALTPYAAFIHDNKISTRTESPQLIINSHLQQILT
jgi:hypothetical protein